MDSWNMPHTRRQAMEHKHLSHSSLVGRTNGEGVGMVESMTGNRL
jgi:hypothetical protein